MNKKVFLSSVFSLVVAGYFAIIALTPMAIENSIKKQEYKKAISLSTLRILTTPLSPKGYSLRAYANFKTKNFEKAIDDYDKAYRLEYDEYKMMNFDNKIYIRFINKDYETALKDFDKEIENTKDDYIKDSFLWDKAQFLFNIKNYEEALKIYNQLLINSESDAIFLLENRLYYERAQVLKAMGRNDEAKMDIVKSQNLSLEPIFQNPIPQPKLIMEDFEEDNASNPLE